MKKKPKTKKNNPYVGTRLTTEMHKTIKDHAETYGRTISKEVFILLRDALAARATNHPLGEKS